jgi:hypothetical protein
MSTAKMAAMTAAMSATVPTPAMTATAMTAASGVSCGRKHEGACGEEQRGRGHDDHVFYAIFHLDFSSELQSVNAGAQQLDPRNLIEIVEHPHVKQAEAVTASPPPSFCVRKFMLNN